MTSFQVEEEGELPSGVCCVCLNATLSAVHFRRLCVESNQHWIRILERLANVRDPDEYDRSYFIFYGSEPESIIRDQREKVGSKKEVVERLTATLEKEPYDRRPRRAELLKCKCPDCGKQFISVNSLNFHLKGSMNTACTECGDVFTRESITKHMTEEHGENIIVCEICQMNFKNNKAFEQHFVEMHNSKKYICWQCGWGFFNSRALRTHMYSHTLFHCPTCSMSFENRKCNNYHQKHCKGKSKSAQKFTYYECDHCGYKYDKKQSLTTHVIQKHLNVLPFECEQCGKRVSTRAHLRSHQETHKVHRVIFRCHCGATFLTENGFRLHERIHTGVKPYRCDYCGDYFLSSSRRLDHIKRRHRSNNDLPRACDRCPMRFIRPYELKKHYLSVHASVIDVTPKKRARKCNGSLQLLEEPACPIGACVNCTGAAVAANDFRTLIKESQRLWSGAVNSLETLQLPCTAPYVQSLHVYINTDDLNLKTFYSSSGSPKVFKRTLTKVNRFTASLKQMSESFATKDRKPRTPRSGPTCECTDCGQTFPGPHYLNLHLKNSGQKDACVICGAVVTRGQGMQDHLHSVHRQHTFLCSNCPALFNEELDFKKHLKVAHKAGAWTCGDCGRTFPRSGGFEAHSQMHAVRTCRVCGTQFTNRGCYRRHRSLCEPNAKPYTLSRNRRSNIRDPATFTCDYCGKTYHSRPQLKNHIIWIHMDVRPHQCQWCGKRFYTPARLSEHKVVHTRERKFECDICGLKLVSKMAVVYHRRRHTGEKPYQCEDCDEKFISASRRSEHAKRRHGKGFRFGCEHCSATFVRGHELKKHVDKAHGTQSLPVSVKDTVSPPLALICTKPLLQA